MSAYKKKIRSSGFWGRGQGGLGQLSEANSLLCPSRTHPELSEFELRNPGHPGGALPLCKGDLSVHPAPCSPGLPWVLSTVGELGAVALSEVSGPLVLVARSSQPPPFSPPEEG